MMLWATDLKQESWILISSRFKISLKKDLIFVKFAVCTKILNVRRPNK